MYFSRYICAKYHTSEWSCFCTSGSSHPWHQTPADLCTNDKPVDRQHLFPGLRRGLQNICSVVLILVGMSTFKRPSLFRGPTLDKFPWWDPQPMRAGIGADGLIGSSLWFHLVPKVLYQMQSIPWIINRAPLVVLPGRCDSFRWT